MAFPFLTIFMILIVFIYIRTRSGKSSTSMAQEIFDRENAANSTRAVDLDTLTYISIPFEKFPIGVYHSDAIDDAEDALDRLKDVRILNITGVSNTELKEKYGPKNLPDLTEYGDNFDELTLALVNYAKALLEENDLSAAIAILEYGVGIGTDLRANYILLGECYIKASTPAKIDNLIEILKSSNLLLAPSIIGSIEKLTSPDTSSES